MVLHAVRNNRNKAVVPDNYISGNGSPKFKQAFYNHLEGNLDRNNNFISTSTAYQDSTIQGGTKYLHQTSENLHNPKKSQNLAPLMQPMN